MLATMAFEILERVVRPSRELTPAEAKVVLEFRFPEADENRHAVLAAKANEGELTPVEREEYEAYIRIAHLLIPLRAAAMSALSADARVER